MLIQMIMESSLDNINIFYKDFKNSHNHKVKFINVLIKIKINKKTMMMSLMIFLICLMDQVVQNILKDSKESLMANNY